MKCGCEHAQTILMCVCRIEWVHFSFSKHLYKVIICQHSI
jgi:hypothetical protein